MTDKEIRYNFKPAFNEDIYPIEPAKPSVPMNVMI
jgi:hypothetical protein